MNKLNAIIIEDDFFMEPAFFWSLQVTDIAYFYSENKYLCRHPKRQEHIINLSLNKQMEQLASEQFFRANR